MKHPRLFAVGGVAALALSGGITAATMTGSSAAQAAGTAVATGATIAERAPATIHATTVRVGGRSVRILETSKGLPLYIYGHDTTTASRVTGELKRFWSPLDSSHPTESDVTGKLTVVKDANGSQVRYDNHFLYTFAEDTPGHPTGQGAEDFFLATPTGVDKTVPSPPAPAAPTPPASPTPPTTPPTAPTTTGTTGYTPPTTAGNTGPTSPPTSPPTPPPSSPPPASPPPTSTPPTNPYMY